MKIILDDRRPLPESSLEYNCLRTYEECTFLLRNIHTIRFDQMRADFTGIGVTTASKERLYIGNVWQNNKIQINEEGTKAYSITGLDTLCYSCIEQLLAETE